MSIQMRVVEYYPTNFTQMLSFLSRLTRCCRSLLFIIMQGALGHVSRHLSLHSPSSRISPVPCAASRRRLLRVASLRVSTRQVPPRHLSPSLYATSSSASPLSESPDAMPSMSTRRPIYSTSSNLLNVQSKFLYINTVAPGVNTVAPGVSPALREPEFEQRNYTLSEYRDPPPL